LIRFADELDYDAEIHFTKVCHNGRGAFVEQVGSHHYHHPQVAAVNA